MAPIDNKTFVEYVGGLISRSPDVPITANANLLDLWALAIYAGSDTLTVKEAYMRASMEIDTRNQRMRELKENGTLLPQLTPPEDGATSAQTTENSALPESRAGE